METQNTPTTALSIFGQQRVMKFKALAKDEARALYEKENENISLTAEAWHFEDEATQEEFSRNPNIVADLLEKLKTAKENEFELVLQHLRKYQRKQVILHGFFTRDVVDKVTGETSPKPYVRMFDPYTGKAFTMGQGVATGFFADLETTLQAQNGTACGIAFDITYIGRKKNATNSHKSDRFEIKISEAQPLQDNV